MENSDALMTSFKMKLCFCNTSSLWIAAWLDCSNLKGGADGVGDGVLTIFMMVVTISSSWNSGSARRIMGGGRNASSRDDDAILIVGGREE